MLYTGPIILQNLLDESHYNHFLLFHMGLRILCSPHHYISENDLAQKFLEKFVVEFASFYGRQNVSYNVHMTIHLHPEARLHGSLDTFSAFQFENFMGGLKGLTKRYARPLEQIHNRIHEHSVIIGSQRDTEKSFRVYP
jgi:hypothetical protein